MRPPKEVEVAARLADWRPVAREPVWCCPYLSVDADEWYPGTVCGVYFRSKPPHAPDPAYFLVEFQRPLRARPDRGFFFTHALLPRR